jgi:hypothetical protein
MWGREKPQQGSWVYSRNAIRSISIQTETVARQPGPWQGSWIYWRNMADRSASTSVDAPG